MTPRFRVLYAEDNAQDADLTRASFSERAPEFRLEVVGSGQACLSRLSAESFDLLLLDHCLPDMEGLDVLRALVHSGAALPVVLVTGSGDEELVVKALRLGAANYVPKVGDYLDNLPTLLSSAISAYRLKRSQGSLPPGPRRVLYVEHHAMDIELTERHFAEYAPHFKLDVVRRCADAVVQLGRAPAYDAVVVDLRMPDQSGLEFVHEVKRLGLAVPPFILISGKGDESAAIASLALGVADYVTKRDGYLNQLPYTIDRVIAHDRLNRINERLQAELLERSRADKERMELEEQLRASQKLEAIGSLAGGIAHDFNNLLSVIMNYADAAIYDLPESHPSRADVLEVQKAAKRAAELTRQLLAFSRKQVLQPRVLDVNQVLSGIEKMLRRILGEDIEFAQVLAPDLGLTLADPGQLEQVLMNLVVNARDAMASGGQLTIETSNVDGVGSQTEQPRDDTGGAYIRISVKDTGSGMEDAVKERIFEPFFTTKERGKGTGLGLSTAYGIVKQSGGNISVCSELGVGTTFLVDLPRQLNAGAAAAIKHSVAPNRATGHETILVVEDEEALGSIIARTLRAAGYQVVTAASGQDALLAVASYPGEVHLLLTDVVMPRMSGRSLAQALAKSHPNVAVVYMSGYTDDAILHHGALDTGTQFIAKPFAPAALLRKIRDVLDGDERA